MERIVLRQVNLARQIIQKMAARSPAHNGALDLGQRKINPERFASRVDHLTPARLGTAVAAHIKDPCHLGHCSGRDNRNIGKAANPSTLPHSSLRLERGNRRFQPMRAFRDQRAHGARCFLDPEYSIADHRPTGLKCWASARSTSAV
jgi:hypothetical protein